MARPRKTIEVARIKEMANKFFKESADEMVDEREALKVFIDSILFETNNYHGFNMLYWLEQGFEEWNAAGKPDGNEWVNKDGEVVNGYEVKKQFFGDESRVKYY